MDKSRQKTTYLALERLKMSGGINKNSNENIHDAIICFDEAGFVIDCEEAFFDIFAATDAQDLVSNFYNYMPEFQPDGRISQTFFKNQIKDTFGLGLNEKGFEFSWLFKRSDGKYIQADVTLSRCSKPNADYVICHMVASYDESLPISQEDGRDMNLEVASLLHHAPGVIFFIDEHLNILECNQYALEAFFLKDKTEFANKFFTQFTPKFQNSIRAQDLMRIQIQRTKSMGSAQFNWNIKRDYEETSGSIKLVRTTYMGKDCCVAYLNEFQPDNEVYFDEPLENNLLGERMWSILDGMPFVWQFLDTDFTCIDCNLAAVRMFGFKDKQEYINKYLETFPATQPCGTPSITKAKEYINKAMDVGLITFEWMHNKTDGTLIPGEVTLMRLGIKNRFVLVAFVRDLREAKALETIQRSEDQRMRVILDSIPAVCEFWDAERELILCNNASAELFGLESSQEYLDKHDELSPRFQPCGRQSSELVLRYINEAFEKGHCKFDWMHQKLDGTPIPCEIVLTRVNWQNGYGLVGFTTDLRRHYSEMELKERERQRFAVMLDSIPATITLWNNKREIVMCNESITRLFDISSTQEYIESFYMLSPEIQPCGTKSTELAYKYIEEAFKTGYCKFDWIHRKFDGTLIPSMVELRRVFWEDDYGLVGYTVDMREALAEEERRKQEEEKIAILLDNIPAVVANFWDEDCNIIDCNQTVTELFGVKTKQEYMENFHKLSPEFQPDGSRSDIAVKEKMRAAFESGREVFEWMHQDMSGESIPAQITLVRVSWRDGHALMGYCYDMRKEYALRQERKLNDQRLRAVMDNVPACLNFWDTQGNLLFCNKHTIDYLGLDPKGNITEQFFARYPEYQADGKKSIEATTEALVMALETGSSKISWIMLDGDGNDIPAMCHLYRIEWGDGYAVFEFIQDLRVEHAIRKQREISEQRLQVILESVPSTVNFWSSDGTLLFCNDYVAKLLGFDSKEDYLVSPYDSSPEFQPNGRRSDEWNDEIVRRVFTTGNPERVTWRFKHKDGSLIPMDCILTRVNWGEGYAVLEFCRDLREEQELLKSKERDEERLRAVIESTPAAVYVWDRDHNLLFQNSYMQTALEHEDDEVMSLITEYYPDFQPDGKASYDYSKEMISKAFTEGSAKCEFVTLTSKGNSIPLECTLVRVPWENDFVVVEFCRDLREEYRQRELHRSYEERLKLIVDNMPLACSFRDQNFAMIDANQAALNLFGVSDFEEYSASLSKFSPSHQPCGTPSREKALEYVKIALEEGRITFRWMNQKMDGSPMPTELTIIRVQWQGQTMICTFTRDLRAEIAERQGYKALEERLRAMVDASPNICFILNRKGRIVDCNRLALDVFGVKSKLDFSKNFLKLHPETQPNGENSRKAIKGVLENMFANASTNFEWTFKSLDGQIIPANISTLNSNLEGNNVTIVYVLDMRETIKYENEQKAARERILAMINASPMMCYVCDTSYNIIDCNDVAPALVGLDNKQAFIDIFRTLHPKKQEDGRTSLVAAADHLGRALAEGNSTFNWLFRKPNGDRLPVESSASRVELNGQQLLVVYSRDLRESIKYEQEQKIARERMSAMVNASPMMCFVCDADFNVLDCNDRVLDILNLDSKKEFISNFTKLHPRLQPDGTHSLEAAGVHFRRAFIEGNATFEWHFEHPSNREALPVEASITRVELADQQLLVAYCRDLRDHYKYLEDQRIAKERMDTMIDASPLACFFMDRKANLIDCNMPALRLFGLDTKQELFSEFSILSPKYQPDGKLTSTRMHQTISEIFEVGKAKFEWLHFNSKGEELPVEVNAKKVILQGDEYAIIYLRDLRDSIRLREERRIARERLEAMLDASPLACSILDNKSNILICNESAVKLFELNNKDEYIANFLQLLPDIQPDGRSSLEKIKESIARAFMDVTAIMTFEWMFQTLSGDLLPSEVTLKPVTLDDETLMIAYIQDLRHIKQAAMAAEALEKLAYTDSLTGANNRRYFVDAAERELKTSIAENYPFTLIMLDIDDFKAINDSFGHVVGDGVLKILVSRMRHTLRKNVVVARYGGEEFVIMLPGMPEDAAERTAWRIRKNIESSKFLVEGAKVPVTVSLGVAGRSDTDDELTSVIVKADKALYEAKSRGKNTVIIYDNSLENKFSDATIKQNELKGRNNYKNDDKE